MAAQQRPEPGTVVARQEAHTAPVQGGEPERRGPVGTLLMAQRAKIEHFLPRGVTLERVIAEVGMAVRENAQILECTQESIIKSVVRALRMDLEIGVEFFLVPFREKGQLVCTGIPGYKGLARLAISCGAARSVEARCRYEGDEWEMAHGLTPILRHVPVQDAAKRGALLGAYYLIRLPRGADPIFDFLPIADIEAVRAKSKQWGPDKVKECPPWWAEKRAVLVGLKLVPKTPRSSMMETLIDRDEQIEFEGEEEVEVRRVSRGPEPVRALPSAAPMPSPVAGVAPVGYEDEQMPVRGGAVETVVADPTPNPRAIARAQAEPDPYETVEQTVQTTVQVKRCRECGGTIDARGRGHAAECSRYADVFDDDEDQPAIPAEAPAGSGSSAAAPAADPELPLEGGRETQTRKPSGRMPKGGRVADAILPREDGDPF